MLDKLRAAVTAVGADPQEILLNCTRLVECEGRTLDDMRLAESAARGAAAQLPADLQAMHRLAYVLELTGESYLEEAARLDRTVGEATSDRKPWLQYVAVERRLRQSDRAVRVLSERIAARPADTGAQYALIYALLQADQAQDSLTTADRALAIAPDDTGLHNLRGDILARLGRPIEAEGEWLRTLALDSRYVDARYSLAFTYESRGNMQAALAEWKELLAFLLREFPEDPAYIWAQDNVKRLGG